MTAPAPIPAAPKPAAQSRLVCVDVVYFQEPGRQPVAAESRFTRRLDGREQPYVRRREVGEEWSPIDSGWLEDRVGLLVIDNEAGKTLTSIPTPAQREAIAAQVIEVGWLPPAPAAAKGRTMFDAPPPPPPEVAPLFLVRPGEGQRFEPIDPARLRVRCRSGSCPASFRLYPQ